MNNPLNLALDLRVHTLGIHPLLFLACPYSHPDRMVRAHRALLASDMTARLMGQGYGVFSPISHGHAVCEADMTVTIGTDAASWSVVNDRVMHLCNALVVLDIPGLWESLGVRREVSLAAKYHQIPINLIRSNGNGLEVEPGIDPMLFSDGEGRL